MILVMLLNGKLLMLQTMDIHKSEKEFFLFGYKKTTKHYNNRLLNSDWFSSDFVFSSEFPSNVVPFKKKRNFKF